MNTAELQLQIADRDELVQVLTQQLEQAAEQLDRLQRSGGISARNATPLPAEFLKQQETIGQDVAFLVNQWETSQIAGSVGRIELQLEELRDMIAQMAAAPGSRSASASPGYRSAAGSAETHSALHDVDLLATLQEALNRDEEYIPEVALPEEILQAARGRQQPPAEHDYELPPLPTPPELIDLDQAGVEQLKEAVTQRDQYIRLIVEEFRQLHQSACLQPPVNWQELEQVPEEMKEHLEKLERQLQEQLRLSEVSMSIERARLSREATHLELSRMQLQKQMKKQGIDPREIPGLEFLAEEKNASSADKQRGQKWLSMLRIKES